MQKHNPLLVLTTFLSIIGLVGCAVFGDNNIPIEQAEGYFFFGCGLADGGAYTIYIPEEPVSACSTWDPPVFNEPFPLTFTQINLTRFPHSNSDSTTPIYFGNEDNPDLPYGSAGWAGFCMEGERSCKEAQRGSILIPTTLDDLINTHVDILFEDGSMYNRQLEIRVCKPERPVLCG